MEVPKNHPSYGTVGFTRVSHGGQKRQLFGSSLDGHQTTVYLRICEADLSHRLGEDVIFDKNRIIEVELSAAQFAELLTSMNMGSGVACTIRRRDGKSVPDPPTGEREVHRVREDFEQQMRDLGKTLKSLAADTEAILTSKETITKEKKASIRAGIAKVVQEVNSNIPFMHRCFEEATQRITSAAKAEVDAFMTTAIHNAGIEALAKKLTEAPDTIPALPPSEENL